MRRVLLIVNPFASRVSDERVALVEHELARVAEVRTVRTERPGHATELAEAACRDCETIVVYSGDGGFNEAVNGVDGTVPLGFLPGGGTSVLSRALGLPVDPIAAARQLAEAVAAERTRRISLGRANGRRFAFSSGIGLDAELVRRVDSLGRRLDGRRPGDLAFLRTLGALLVERRGRFEPTLDVRGVGRAAFALVANADPYTYAGPVPIRVAPCARFEEGLDLVAPARVTPAGVPRFLLYVLRGGGQQRARDVHYLHDVDRLEIACDRPLPLQVDGEDLGDVESVEVECERAALSVLA